MEQQANDKPNAQGKKPIVPILACLLVLAVGVGIYLFMNQAQPKNQVQVPDIVYMELTEAEAQLAEAGLKVGTITEEEDEEIPIGDVVLDIDPEAETTVDEGTEVDIIVSKGPKLTDTATVPDVVGLSPEEAEEVLADAMFIPMPGKQVYSDTVEPGKVCAQSIKANSDATILSVVTYDTSLGKEQVSVPDVTGKTAKDARNALNKAGLGVDTTTSYNDKVAKDSVISQSVAKGTKVTKGTIVTLELSLGPKPATTVPVPNILSYTRDDAIRALESAGLDWDYSGDENGTVVSVRPAPNTQVEPGRTVTFELRAPQQVTAPRQTTPQATNTSDDVSDDDDGDDGDDGMTAQYTRSECEGIALDSVDAGGNARNVTSSGPTTGGGTVYYMVDFDLNNIHYSVEVDAIGGNVINVTETDNGTGNEDVIDGKELPDNDPDTLPDDLLDDDAPED